MRTANLSDRGSEILLLIFLRGCVLHGLSSSSGLNIASRRVLITNFKGFRQKDFGAGSVVMPNPLVCLEGAIWSSPRPYGRMHHHGQLRLHKRKSQ